MKPNRAGGEVRQANAVSIFSVTAVFAACIVLAPLLPTMAEAQDNICSETTTVLDIDSTTADRTESFRTTQESFLVIYDVDFTDDQNSDNSFDLEIRDGSRVVESETATEDGPSSFRVLEQPGSFTVEADVEPDKAAEYEVLIEECADEDGGGGNGDGAPGDDQYDNDDGGADDGDVDDGDVDDGDGDVDDPDDVVPGTGTDKPLPNTGGAPLLLGAVSLALAAALVARRTLAP